MNLINAGRRAIVINSIVHHKAWFASSAAAASSEVQNRIRGAYYGALISDALCLGSHYEYDAKKIKQAYGGTTISKYYAPGEQMGGVTHGIVFIY